MPEVPAIRAIDSIERVPYRIGYSFRQPEVVKLVTKTNKRPYFAMDWAASVNKRKADLYKSGKLQKFPSVWRRSAKSIAVQGLEVVGNRRELPNFQELGAAPGPTDKETVNSTMTRDFMGFLQNGLKYAGELISQSQELEIAKAQAQNPYATQFPQGYNPYSNQGGIGTLGWAMIVGTVGVGAFMYLRNK